jgi:hypothetical protein
MPVLRAAARAKPSATRPPLLALCGTFVVAAWADVAIIAAGELRLLDALGLALLVGVLGQAIATALTYVVPALRGRTIAERSQITARMAHGTATRTVAYNLGALAVIAAAAGGPSLEATGALLSAAGWTSVVAVLLVQIAMALWPLNRRAGPA